MRFRAKRWAVFTLSASAALLLLCALAVFLVDPFEHYRESSILPLYDQESYNNPGIARNYDYDAVILGTSMVEMSHPSVIDACFDVTSVKLPMRGSHISQMGWQLTHVLKTHELKLAILAVDAYSMMGQPDDMEEIYDYLWNDDPLDDVNYLFNRDVVLVKIPKMLQNIGKPLAAKRDNMYQWTDVVFSAQSVFDAIPAIAQKDMQSADTNLSRSTENVERHLIPSIEAHPETVFKIYMPPYSVGYWFLMTREGISEQQFRSRRLLCEKLLDYPNVEIYDYSSRIDWITDLNQYFDYSHHSGEVSDRLMRAMAAGENRVFSVSDMEAGSERIRQARGRFCRNLLSELTNDLTIPEAVMTIIVLDGQGGGIGRAIIAALSPLLPQGAQLLCVGTNAMATAAMLKAGAQRGATGENAVCWAARNADILIAPIALVLKDSMMGEITGNMAAAVGSSRATRILVPTERCGTHVAGAHGVSMQSLVEDAARQAAALAAQA